MIVTSRLIIGISVIISCATAFAQSNPTAKSSSSSAAKEKKKTAINFDDQLVQGEVRKPELFYLLQKKQFNFGRLIKLRENFLPEMRKTSEDIERGGNAQ